MCDGYAHSDFVIETFNSRFHSLMRALLLQPQPAVMVSAVAFG